MMLRRTILSAAAAIGMVLPAVAHAHPGHVNGGLIGGFTHPFSGLDHILVMMLVGLVAARSGGRALILLPATFIVVMVLGSLSGITGANVSIVELGIATSLVALGVCAMFNVRIPAALAMTATALFAFFHGQAHGAELPADTTKLPFVAGFVIATATLHLIGIAAWIGLSRHSLQKHAAQILGAVSMLLGAVMAAGIA